MSFTSEVKARLSLDTTPFSRALTKATADLGEAGDDMQRKLQRSFGAGDVFKGLLQGLGIGSVQAVVDKLVGGYERAAEQAKTLAETTARTLGLYQAIYASRRTDEQNLTENLKEQARLQAQIAGTTEQSEMRDVYGPGGKFQARFVTRQANPQRAVEIAQELAQLAKEEQDLRGKIQKAAEATSKEEIKRVEDVSKAQAELAEIEQANAMKQQTLDEQINTLIDKRESLRDQMNETADQDLSMAKELARVEGRLLDLEKQRAEEAKKASEEAARYAQRVAAAKQSLAESRRAATLAFKERSAVTLQDVAQGAYGTTQTQRARAREVMRLEEQAKRQRATGFDAGAADSTARALRIRKSMGQLGEAESDPMADAREAIKKSEEHLAEIRASLKVVQSGGGSTKTDGGKTK